MKDHDDKLVDGLREQLRTASANVLEETHAPLYVAGLLLIAEQKLDQLAGAVAALTRSVAAASRVVMATDPEEDEVDVLEQRAAVADAGRCRHKWADGKCSLCGKPKGKQGRKPAPKPEPPRNPDAASTADPAMAGKADPPSHALPLRPLLASVARECSTGGPHTPGADEYSPHCIKCGKPVFTTALPYNAADRHAERAEGKRP